MRYWLWLFDPSNLQHYYHEWFLGLILLVIGIAIATRSKQSLLFLPIAWAILSGLTLMWFPLSKFGDINSGEFQLISLNAAKSLISCIAVLGFAFTVKVKWIEKWFAGIALLSSLLLLTGKDQGFFFNDSMESSFLAVLIPLLLLGKRTKWFLVPVIAAIVKSGSVTSFLALLVSVGVFYFKPKRLAFGLLAIPAYFIFPLHHGITVGSGRIEVWSASLQWFQNHGNPWLVGFGTGAYAMMSPAIFPKTNFIWPHCEPLLIFFDNGMVGVALTLVAFLWALTKSIRSKLLLSSLLTYGLVSCFQWPFHHIVSAVYGAYLLRRVQMNPMIDMTDGPSDYLGSVI